MEGRNFQGVGFAGADVDRRREGPVAADRDPPPLDLEQRARQGAAGDPLGAGAQRRVFARQLESQEPPQVDLAVAGRGPPGGTSAVVADQVVVTSSGTRICRRNSPILRIGTATEVTPSGPIETGSANPRTSLPGGARSTNRAGNSGPNNTSATWVTETAGTSIVVANVPPSGQPTTSGRRPASTCPWTAKRPCRSTRSAVPKNRSSGGCSSA